MDRPQVFNIYFDEFEGWSVWPPLTQDLHGKEVVSKHEYDVLYKKHTIAVEALKEASEYVNKDDVNGVAGEIAFDSLIKLGVENG